MAELIETQGASQWLDAVKVRFKIEHTRLVETDEAFTIFLKEEVTPNRTVMVGRFCRSTGVGIIMDRRGDVRGNDKNHNTNR